MRTNEKAARAWDAIRAVSASAVPALAVVALACGGGPTAPPDPPPVPPHAELTCTADVRAATIHCVPTVPEAVARSPAVAGVAVGLTPAAPAPTPRAAILGDQGVDIELESSDVCFEDGCDPAAPAGIFQASVTVRNLTGWVLGSADGVSADSAGVRVFFHRGPVVVATSDGDSGSVVVHDPDGTGSFTGTDQPYYQYDEALPPGAVSEAKRWRWHLSDNVVGFEFGVLVAAEAADPPPTPFVVFDLLVEGNRDIYRADLDGSGVARLTTSPAEDREATVAGESVVFVSYRDGNAELYALSLAEPDAAPVRLTATAANETQPALSPDGSQLAFMSDVSGVPRLWVSNADGSGAAPVTTGFGHAGAIEASPNWSPDGARIVFMSTAGGNADLYVLEVESGSITLLVGGARAEVEPTWSPDGAHVVFASNREGPTRLYRVEVGSAAGGEASVEALTLGEGADGQPAYLPDGRVVYTSWESGAPELRWLDPAEPGEWHAIPLPEGTPGRPAGALGAPVTP